MVIGIQYLISIRKFGGILPMKNLIQRLSLSCLIIIITASSYAGNYLPILTWPGTGTYKSDGLDPEVGIEGTTFTFRVKYIDYDNEAPPGDVRVVINTTNGEIEFPMLLEGTNKDYRKGVIYRYATSTLTADTHYSYYFKVTDNLKIAITERSGVNGETEDGLPEEDRFPMANKFEPVANKFGIDVVSGQIHDWIGSGNYESDGLHPENGGTNTVFTYKIKYFGTSSPLSGYPMVTIMDSGGIVATRTMNPEAGGTLLDGKVYSATHTFSSSADRYTYDVKIADDSGNVSGDGPEIYPNTGGVSAFLDWTGESGYENDGVEPDIASYGSTFTYRIKYVNVEGIPPDVDYPTISMNGNEYQMNFVSGTFATGAIYQYQGIYPDVENGTITGSIIVLSNGTQSDKPINFYAVNIPPLLTWTGEPGYTNDGVQPNIGTAGTTFTFRIKYTDTEENIPQGVMLKISDGSSSQMTLDSNGIYKCTGTFSLGEHNYYFYASDSMSKEAGGSEMVVNASDISVPVQLATFTVSIGILDSVSITGTDAIRINESAIFTAHAFNEFNREIRDSDVVYSWEIIEGTGSLISGIGSKTVTLKAGTSTGNIVLNVNISPDPNSTLQGDDISGTKTIIIKPDKPQALFFSETGTNTISVSLPVGSSTGFAISGRDSSGNTVTVTGCNWTVKGSIGSLNTSQESQVVFTAGTSTGTGNVIVSTSGINGTLTATASITIIPGEFHHFDISMGSLTVAVDWSMTITLRPQDINGNNFAGVVPETTIQVVVGTVSVNLGTCAVNTAVEFSWPVELKNTLGTGNVYALIDTSRKGTSSPFSVVSGSPHHFKIASPTTNTAVPAGASIPITAQLQDMYNNPVALGTSVCVVFHSDSFGTFSFGNTSTTSSGTITIQTGANGQVSGTYQPNSLAGSKAVFVGVFLASNNTVCGTSGVSILTVPAAIATITVTTPATVTAGTPDTISIVARDSYNNPATATLTFTGSSLGTITPTGCVITGGVGDGFVWQGGGTWTDAVSFTKAQSQAILNVTAQNGKTATATFNILPAELATMSTAIVPGTVAVVGSLVELRVGLFDRWGNPVATTTVNWESQGLAATTTQTINGTASLTFTLGTKTGEYIVRAQAGTLTATITITAIIGTPILSQNLTACYGTVNKQVNLEVYLRDGVGNPCPGTVAWKLIEPLPSAASLSATATDVDIQTGSSSITLTPGTRSGVYVVRASVGTLTATFTITATPDEPATIINTAITPGTTAMVGSQMVVSIGLSDKYGNQATTTTVTWQSQGIAATTTQTMNGTANLGFTLGTRSGVYIVKAQVGTLTATITITAIPGEPAIMTIMTTGTVTGVISQVELRVGLSDQWGNPVATKTISWQPIGSLTTQILAATTTQTINGTASLTFTLGTKTGEYIVRASFETLTATITITAVPGIPRLSQSFTHDSRTVGSGMSLEIGYRDESGNPGSGTVEWSLIEPLPAAAFLSATFTTINPQTGSSTVTLTLGTKTGEYMVRLRIGALTATITITALPGEPATTITHGPVVAVVNSQVELRMGLFDQYGNSVATTTVNWEPVGTLSSQILAATTTQTTNGTATLGFTLGTKTGEYVVKATYDGRINTFTITAIHGTPLLFPVGSGQITGRVGEGCLLEVKVCDEYGNPATATVSWELGLTPATATLSATNTITDESGKARTTIILGDTSGTYTVRAKADGLSDTVLQIIAMAGTPTESNTTWVGPPPPATATANGTITVAVSICDGYENVVKEGAVNWVVIRGTNTVATITTNIVEGKAEFYCKLGTIAGTYTVNAKFGAILLKSFSVRVNPGIPILFQNFTTKTCLPGADIPLEIGYRDAFGNVVNGTVTWEIMQMPATASWSVITPIINPQTGSSTATLTVGSLTGAYVVRAMVGSLTVSFTITALTEGGASDELLIYPNPVKVQEWDKFTYPDGPWVKFGRFDGQVTVRIYDVSGSLIRIMENVPPDNFFVKWDLKNDDGVQVNSGIYLGITIANGKKMIGRFAVIR